MARIPRDELERLKREVSVERLAEARGVKLERHGADLLGRPDLIVWTGTLKLVPKAAEQLRELGDRLGPQQQILISRNGEPLDVTYARLVGQMMSVGDFASYGELVEAVGGIGSFEEAPEDVVEVFSGEELEAKRKRREMLEESEAMLREAERLREEAAAGRITEEEMVRRLNELRQ